MKTSFSQLKLAEPALRKLLNLDLPVVTAVKFSKLVKQLDSEFNHYEEARIKLVTKYGATNAKGDLEVTQDHMESFAKDMIELGSIDVNIEFDAVPVEKLGDIKMTAVEMMTLSEFLAA